MSRGAGARHRNRLRLQVLSQSSRLRGFSQTALGARSLRHFLVGGSMSLGFAGLLWAFHSDRPDGWLSSVLASACRTIPTGLRRRCFTFGVEGSFVSQAAGTLAIAAWNLPVGAGIVFMLVDLLGWN